MNGTLAGTLTEMIGEGYTFEYDEGYFQNPSMPAISLTLPKVKRTYTSACLFPFFANMLSEGANRAVQARLFHVDADDDFGILLATASVDTPGAVTVMKMDNE